MLNLDDILSDIKNISKNEAIRIGVSLLISGTLGHLLAKLLGINKYLLPHLLFHLAIFLISLYLLRLYWEPIKEEIADLEEGLAPQFLKYGENDFGGYEDMGSDDPDSIPSFAETDAFVTSELAVPRQQIAPWMTSWNAHNVEKSFAYINGNLRDKSEPYMGISGKECDQLENPCAVGEGGCNAGYCNGCKLCSLTGLDRPQNGTVAPSPGPQWLPQRASEVQKRLVEGNYVPVTSVL